MKILFMTPDCSNEVSWLYLHYLEQAVAKIAECKWAGRGHETHVKGENLNDTIKRVMPDADWAVILENAQSAFRGDVVIPNERDCKIAYISGDIYRDPKGYTEFLNEGRWDALLMASIKVPMSANTKMKNKSTYFTPIDPEYYLKNLISPVFHMPFSMNPDLFKPLNQPTLYEVSFLGEPHPVYYPLRHIIWAKLPQLAERNNWRLLIRETPPGQALISRNIDELLKKGYYVGGKYAEVLALSKTFIFATGVGRGPIKKYFEGMAAGTCVLADTPFTAEELHFKPNWNFVEINKSNWKDKLKYYLDHDEEREEIARRGRETILKYHTNSVRSQELVKFLEECS